VSHSQVLRPENGQGPVVIYLPISVENEKLRISTEDLHAMHEEKRTSLKDQVKKIWKEANVEDVINSYVTKTQ